MGGPVGLQPLVGGDLVGADHRAYIVVEDLGRRPGQGGQARVLEPAQVVDEGLPQRRAPSVTSSAVNPCTWTDGAASFTARATSM